MNLLSNSAQLFLCSLWIGIWFIVQSLGFGWYVLVARDQSTMVSLQSSSSSCKSLGLDSSYHPENKVKLLLLITFSLMLSCLSGSYRHHPSLYSQHFFWARKIKIVPVWLSYVPKSWLLSCLKLKMHFPQRNNVTNTGRSSGWLLEAHLGHKQLDYERMRTVTYSIVSMGKCAPAAE